MRFNPPPNWPPPPPGWSPPPGWQPEPWWPPPPPGWPLWVPDAPRRRTRLMVGGILAVFAVVAVIATILGIKIFGVPNREPSDEERILAVVNSLEETYNQSDFEGFRANLCDHVKDEINQYSWHLDDLWSLTVNSVVVTGDKARASVTNWFDGTEESNTDDIPFVREDGRWKACFE